MGYGECLGLLGPNGAGKTSTLNILSGSDYATGGDAYVGGYSVREQLSEVHTVLGVCPQFDTVWDALTVQQHLYLYARIKGVPRNREHIVVQQVGEAVGLDGDEWNQPAAQLSGGH